jgi:hypothetical protein
MCLLPPSSVLSAPRMIQRCSQHDTTCVLASTMHTQCLLCIGTCSPSSKLPCTKCPDTTACKLPCWKPRHCCFVSPKTCQCNWSSDTTHRKVCHFLPCGLPPRQDSYPTSVPTAHATPSRHPYKALQQSDDPEACCTLRH